MIDKLSYEDLKKQYAELQEQNEIIRLNSSLQNEEKGKRAAELIIANKELAFQHEEKKKRAAELEIKIEERTKQLEEKNTNLSDQINEKTRLTLCYQ